MFKQILSVVLCASFISSPALAMETNISPLTQNWSTYLTSEQFGTDMFYVSEGVTYIAFTTLMASLSLFTVYGIYKLIFDNASSSQEANKPRPYYPNEVIDLQVDINLNTQ